MRYGDLHFAMTSRLSALAMLVLLSSAEIGPAAFAASAHAEHEACVAHHDDGTPCPDGDGRHPCGGSCPCLCRPGHAVPLLAPAGIGLSLAVPLAGSRLGPFEAAHPNGVPRRVFRPPRSRAS
jgi:hypothetical protein